MSNRMEMCRVVLFADPFGLNQLLAVQELLPSVVGVVAADRRPQYLSGLKESAAKLGVEFLVQPDHSTSAFSGFQEQLQKLNSNLFLSHSYSMKIPEKTLRLVAHNAVNVHWSLLPKNRGANPVQWAMIKGEEKTGVTLHFMTDTLDGGDIVAQKSLIILPDETWVELKERLFELCQNMLNEEIPKILSGKNDRLPQDESQATVNLRLSEDSPRIDFNTMSDRDVYNLIRAQVFPLKGAFIQKESRRIPILEKTSMEQVAQLREKYGICKSV